MDAQVSKNGEITVVALRGHISFETAEPFRKSLNSLLQEKIVFDLQELNFVGSSGITVFVDLLKEFSARAIRRPKFSSVGSEFRKIFAANAIAPLEIYESHGTAVLSFLDASISPSFLIEPRLIPEFGEDPAWIEEDVQLDEEGALAQTLDQPGT